jgi:membrane fusion protein (multidrug efflux system)
MWINFSISENEMGRIREQAKRGLLKLPETGQFIVQIELVDGSFFPVTGRITFADPSYNSQTGTFLIRASVNNPQGLLRPNQYVRTKLIGATRPNAIIVPQRAVQQSAKGHFVWILTKDNQAEQRPVEVGTWYGDGWFISQGLASGDQVIVDGTLRLAPGLPVKATPYVEKTLAGADATVATATGAPASPGPTSGAPINSVRFATASASLDDGTATVIQTLATTYKAKTGTLVVTGYTDKTGDHSANVDLARRRAIAVRDALVKDGMPADRVRLQEPRDVIGGGDDSDARRVDIAVAG